ncbi:MAG: bifunctional adenosylcobinamide kinase/adenosylcobinamide-phosphate guanylyltransferase [Candidatus Limnocylindrales bacterium]
MSSGILVLGGTRSGKSQVALRRAEAIVGERAAYVATARVGDGEWGERIARHQAERPRGWLTVEAAEDPIAGVASVPADRLVLLDSLGLWVSSLVERTAPLDANWLNLAMALQMRRAGWILVSDEVGLAPVALTSLGRRFVDALGWTNQRAAELADEVVLVVAGIGLRIKP